MPAFPYQKALIDIWFDAFPHTTLLMNFDEQQALTYGSSRGAGWRLDCLGDIRTKANDPYFPTGNVGHLSPASDTRRHSGCRAAAAGLARGVRYCFRMGERPFRGELHSGSGLRWHVTRVNLKSSPIPDDWKPGFESFQKKMGHRFLLRRLEYPKRVVAGSMLIHMWWLNSGVAPAYTNYPLAVQLRSSKDSAVINVPVDVRRWGPGDSVFEGKSLRPREPARGHLRLPSCYVGSSERQARYTFRNRRPRLRRLVLRRSNSDHVTATPALGQRSPRSRQAWLGEIRNPLLLIDASKIRRCDLTE